MDNLISWYGYGHIPFHFILPYIIFRFRGDRIEFVLLEVANGIDLDHLFAEVVFDPMRCSLTTHLLHSWEAAVFYLILCFVARVRALGYGALLHLLVDAPNCL